MNESDVNKFINSQLMVFNIFLFTWSIVSSQDLWIILGSLMLGMFLTFQWIKSIK